MSLIRTTTALLIFALSVSAYAYDTVSILQPWVRATKAGQKVAAAYMELESSGTVTIVKVESAVAKSVEVHSMSEDKGVMKMRKVERLELPARTAVKFTPGGLHLMLMGLKKPLKAGDTVVIKLTLQGADKKQSSLQVDAAVRDTPPAAVKAQ